MYAKLQLFWGCAKYSHKNIYKKSRHPKGCRLGFLFSMILSDGELDVVAPCAKDLVKFRACSSTEVCQHHVARDVYEAKDRVEGNVESDKSRVLSYVDSLELVEVAQHYSRKVVVLKVNECKVLAVFNRELCK